MSPSSKALLPIFLIVAIDVLGLTIVLPILPFYAERYGASPQLVGGLVTVYALCQFFSGPVLGRWSDRRGRKPILILSQIGTCLGFVVLALAHQLWVIFLSRVIDGITAGNLPIAQALISDVTEPKDRAKAFGLIGISFGLGLFIGPGLSAYLSQFGYAAPAWAAAFLSLTSVICTILFLPKTPATSVRLSDNDLFNLKLTLRHLEQPILRRLLLQFLFFSLSFSFFIAGFALFAERRFTFHGHPFGAQQVGIFYAYLGFLGIIIQGFAMGRLVKRWGEKKLVRWGFLTQAIGYGGLALVFRAPFLLLTSTVSSFGSGVLRPALTSLITQNVSRAEQGSILGVTQSLASIAQIVTPLLSGFLIDHHALSLWALSAGGFSFLGLWLTASKASSAT